MQDILAKWLVESVNARKFVIVRICLGEELMGHHGYPADTPFGFFNVCAPWDAELWYYPLLDRKGQGSPLEGG
jgi:hypothetical protein